MSFFTGIINAEHSTVAWLEKELVKFDKAEPSIAKVVDAGLAYITPALQIALTMSGNAAASAIVGGVVSQAQTDLTAASALVTDFGATPTAASIFSSVSTNLSTLLTDAHVTDPKSVAAVQKVITEVGLLGTAVSTAATKVAAA